MSNTKVTREMVAKRAGVCKQTVSCYLNKTRGVSAEVAQRIDHAIKELNYVPNMVARGLSQKRTMSIAVICDNLGNPHYSEIISGIENSAIENDYSVLIFDIASGGDSIVSQIIARRLDGVVVLTFPKRIGRENIQKLKDNGVEIVMTHCGSKKMQDCMQLEPDFTGGIEETLQKLKSLGHRDVVLLSSFSRDEGIDERLSKYTECYERMFARPAVLFTDKEYREASLECGANLAKSLIASQTPFSAVIATNDLMAIGAIKVLSERNMLGGVSVVGFDNMIFSEYVIPSLSSIGYDKFGYGRKLFDMFLERTNGAEARLEYVETRLFARESIRQCNITD